MEASRGTDMATLEEAQSVLRGFRREVREVPEQGFTIDIRHPLLVSYAEMDDYLAVRADLKRPAETQATMAGYYEHVVQFEGNFARRPLRRNDDELKMTSPDELTTIQIARPSTRFLLSLGDTDEVQRSFRRFIAPTPMSREGNFRDLFRFNTIRVDTAPSSPLGRTTGRMHDIAEAAIFHFGYGKGVAISFTKTWERTYYWVGRKEAQTVQFPRRTYNSELVSYYNLALSSESLVLGFLALYKILEFFYPSVSEETLHRKIKDQLVAPDFSHTKPKKLRELAKIVRSFDNKHDELTALKLVISKYFDLSELREWISNYESENSAFFTEHNAVFGSQMKIDTNDNSIVQNVASRIYAIRNALVHNKEGEISRFIPYTGQEEALHKEVQLLLFLAENLIIKTGSDLA